MARPPFVLVVMGVSGAGKSTLGAGLAAALDLPFAEGDALHPPANVAKMKAGQALSDEDRAPWLTRIKQWIDARLDRGESGVIACSALKRAYRDRLRGGRSNVMFVHIAGDEALLRQRLRQRKGHFMPASLLASQFATLEAPGADENAITVSAAAPPADQVRSVIAALERGRG